MPAPDVLFFIGGDITALEQAMARAKQLTATALNIEPFKAAAGEISTIFNGLTGAIQNSGRRLSEIAATIRSIEQGSSGLTAAVIRQQSQIERMIDRIAQGARELGDIPAAAAQQLQKLQQALDATSAGSGLKLTAQQMAELGIQTDRTTRLLRDMAAQNQEALAVEKAASDAAVGAAKLRQASIDAVGRAEGAAASMAAEASKTRARADQQALAAAEQAAAAAARNATAIQSQIKGLQKDLATLQGLRFSTPEVQQQIRATTEALDQLRSGVALTPPAFDEMRTATASATAASQDLTKQTLLANAAAKEGSVWRAFGTDMIGMATRVAIVSAEFKILTTVLGGISSVGSTILEVDTQLAKIAGTVTDLSQREQILSQSTDLIFDAMKRTGRGAQEAGGLILELQKALGDQAGLLQASYIPALALTAQGETNVAGTVQTLVGLYTLYGESLTSATTPQEKMLKLSDMIIHSSNQSVASVKSLVDALGYVGPTAKQSGVDLGLLLALLQSMQDIMVKGTQSGTSLRQVLLQVATDAPKVANAFNLVIDAANPDPIKLLLDVLALLRKELDETGRISGETTDALKTAFPGTREISGLLSLVEIYPKLAEKQRENNAASGDSKRLLDELSKSAGTAAYALGVTLIQSIDDVLARFTGDIPGKLESFTTILRALGTALNFLRVGLEAMPGLAKTGFLVSPDFEEEIGKVQKGLKLAQQTHAEMLASQAATDSFVTGITAGLDRAISKPFTVSPLLTINPTVDTDYIQKKLDKIHQDISRSKALGNVETPVTIRIKIASEDLAEAQAELAKLQNRALLSGLPKDTETQIKALEERIGQRTDQIATLRKQAADASDRQQKSDAAFVKQQLDAEDARLQAVRRVTDELDRQSASLEGQLASTGDISDALQKIADREAAALDKVLGAPFASQDEFQAAVLQVLDNAAKEVQVFWRDVGTKSAAALGEQVKFFTAEMLTPLDELLAKIRTFQNVMDATFTGGSGLELTAAQAEKAAENMDRFLQKTLGITDAQRDVTLFNATLGQTSEQAALNAAAFSQTKLTWDELANSEDLATRNLIPYVQWLATLQQQRAGQALSADIEIAKNQLEVFEGTVSRTGPEVDVLFASLDKLRLPFAKLTADQQQQITQWVAYQRALKEVDTQAGLAQAHLSEFADEIIRTNEASAKQIASLAAGADALERYNTAAQNAAEAQARLDKEAAQFSGDLAGFISASIREAAAQFGTLWDTIDTGAKNTFQAANRSMSDFFFNILQGNVKDAISAFADLGKAILRELSNVLASAVVRDFLSLLGGGGFSSGGIVSLVGGLVGMLSGSGSTGATGGLDPEFAYSGTSGTGGGNALSTAGGTVSGLVKAYDLVAALSTKLGYDLPSSMSLLGDAVTSVAQAFGLVSNSASVAGYALPELAASIQSFIEGTEFTVATAGVGAGAAGAGASGATVGAVSGLGLGGGLAVAGISIPFLIAAIGAGLAQWSQQKFDTMQLHVQRQAASVTQETQNIAPTLTAQNLNATTQIHDALQWVGQFAAFTKDWQKTLADWESTGGQPGGSTLEQIHQMSGIPRNVDAADRLFKAFDKLGIKIEDVVPNVPELRGQMPWTGRTGTETETFVRAWDKILGEFADQLEKIAGTAGAETSDQLKNVIDLSFKQSQINAALAAGGQGAQSKIWTNTAEDLATRGAPAEWAGTWIDIGGVVTKISDKSKEELDSILDHLQKLAQFTGATDALTQLTEAAGLAKDTFDVWTNSAEDLATRGAPAEWVGTWVRVGNEVKNISNATAEDLQTIAMEIRKNLLDQLEGVPEKIVALLSPEQLAPLTAPGDTADQTREKLRQTFASLNDLLKQVDAEVAAFNVHVKTYEETIADFNKTIADAGADLANAVDPYAILSAAARGVAAIQGRAQAKLAEMDRLVASIASLTDTFVSSMTRFATIANTANDLGRALDGATASMANAVRWIGQLDAQIAALGPLFQLANAEARQNAARVYNNNPDNITAAVRAGLATLRPLQAPIWQSIAGAGVIGDPQKRAAAFGSILDQLDNFYQTTVSGIHEAYGVARDQAQAIHDEQIRNLEDLKKAAQDEHDAQIDAIRKAEDAAKKAADTQITAIQDQANAQTKALQDQADAQIKAIQDQADTQTKALESQRTALQAIVDESKQWHSVVDSISSKIFDLLRGSASPLTNPSDRLALAASEFDRVLASFRATPTPEGAGKVQDIGQAVIEALGEAFPRPSTQYEVEFNKIIAALQEVQGIATAGASPEEQAVAQLETLNAQIDEIKANADAQIEAIRSNTDSQVEAIKSSADAQIEAINAQLDATLAGFDEQTTEIDNTLKLKLDDLQSKEDQLNEDLKRWLAHLSEDETQAVQDVKDTLAPIFQAAYDFYVQAQKDSAAALAIQQQQLNAITGGQDIEVYRTQVLTDMARDLAAWNVNVRTALRDFVGSKLDALMADLGFPIALSASTFDKGTPFVPQTQMATVHRGETIINAGDSDLARKYGFARDRGPGHVVFNFTIKDSENPKKTMDYIVDKVSERLLRPLGADMLQRASGRSRW